MIKSSNQIYRFFAATLFCLTLLAQGNASFAYYWGSGLGWGYYSLGSSLLWPLSYRLFPYAGYANPYNLTTSAYRLGYSGSQAAAYSLYSPYRYLPYSSPYNANLGNKSGNPTQSPGLPYYNAAQRANDPNDIFNASPMTAPDRRYTTGQPEINPTDLSTPTIPNAAALDGFFQTISTRYKGDLLKALQQPDTRTWAQSLGLIEPEQTLPIIFPKARKNQISSILKDHSIDVYKKLDLLKLLLK